MEPSDLTQNEVVEWSSVNRELRQHGMPTVYLDVATNPRQPENAVYFDVETSKLLRDSLRSLMRDTTRRQELIKELIDTNTQLRQELKAQTDATERYEVRCRELRAMLEESIQQHGELGDSRLTHESFDRTSEAEESECRETSRMAMQSRCKQLEVRCRVQAEEVTSLSKQLAKYQEQEERDRVRRAEALSQLQRQMPRGGTMQQDQVVDVLDLYERELHRLRRIMASRDEVPELESSGPDAAPVLKPLIKGYKKELKECRHKLSKLENDNELLRLELQARPELKDFRNAQQKIKKLEREAKNQNTSRRPATANSGPHSTELEHIDKMSAALCRRHLREICGVIGVEDLQDIPAAVQSYDRMAAAYVKLEEFAHDILRVVDSERSLRHPEYPTQPAAKQHELWCEKSVVHVIPTLQYWQRQLKAVQALQPSVTDLSTKLLPRDSSESSQTAGNIEHLVKSLSDLLLVDPSATQEQRLAASTDLKGCTSRTVLQGIVDHFMKLFDVRHISSVYTRMNDIYTKLGEANNAMKALREILGLGDTASVGSIVEAVFSVCEAHNATTTQQLKSLLQTHDLDSVEQRLKEHEEFFPVFHSMVESLMDILGVSRIDLVVPTVRSLKVMAGR